MATNNDPRVRARLAEITEHWGERQRRSKAARARAETRARLEQQLADLERLMATASLSGAKLETMQALREKRERVILQLAGGRGRLRQLAAAIEADVDAGDDGEGGR